MQGSQTALEIGALLLVGIHGVDLQCLAGLDYQAIENSIQESA